MDAEKMYDQIKAVDPGNYWFNVHEANVIYRNNENDPFRYSTTNPSTATKKYKPSVTMKVCYRYCRH